MTAPMRSTANQEVFTTTTDRTRF